MGEGEGGAEAAGKGMGEGGGGGGSGGDGGGGAVGNNPLLGGEGLVRPIWRPPVDSRGQATTTVRQRKNVWRRVQDDNKDDHEEAWILDGTTHGATDHNTHEDGSAQECG